MDPPQPAAVFGQLGGSKLRPILAYHGFPKPPTGKLENLGQDGSGGGSEADVAQAVHDLEAGIVRFVRRVTQATSAAVSIALETMHQAAPNGRKLGDPNFKQIAAQALIQLEETLASAISRGKAGINPEDMQELLEHAAAVAATAKTGAEAEERVARGRSEWQQHEQQPQPEAAAAEEGLGPSLRHTLWTSGASIPALRLSAGRGIQIEAISGSSSTGSSALSTGRQSGLAAAAEPGLGSPKGSGHGAGSSGVGDEAEATVGALRAHLRFLQPKDERLVLALRKIGRLGLDSVHRLRQYFEGYGKVEDILVSRSYVKCVGSRQRRVRLSGLGFVVMADVDVAQAILASSKKHIVNDVEIMVLPFQKPQFLDEIHLFEAHTES